MSKDKDKEENNNKPPEPPPVAPERPKGRKLYEDQETETHKYPYLEEDKKE